MFNNYFQDPVPDMSTAVARAEAGATFLERKFGEAWHQKIDAESLNIASPVHCVLGQLLRQGHWGMAWLSLRQVVDCGFSCGLWDFLFFAQPPWIRRSFHRLNEAWKLVLANRVQQAAQPRPRLAAATTEQNERGDTDPNRFTCVN